MTEPTRAWIYRLLVLALVGYVLVARPDSIETVVPTLLGLLAGGLATGYTRTRR